MCSYCWGFRPITRPPIFHETTTTSRTIEGAPHAAALAQVAARPLIDPYRVLVTKIMDLCHDELENWGTSDYTGSIPVEDVLQAVEDALIDSKQRR